MKRLLLYSVVCFAGFLLGCEDVYEPKLDSVEGAIVAEARIVFGQQENYVYLTKSLGFYENENETEQVHAAVVKIVDSDGGEIYLAEEAEGGKYKLNAALNEHLSYKLVIEKSGKTYESEFESVPEIPELDTVYGSQETVVIQEGGENNVDKFEEVEGMRLYADIASNPEKLYYRFSARKVLLYTYPIQVLMFGTPTIINVYCWRSFYPQGLFNIAAPPGYSSSKDIKKHPLFFLNDRLVLQNDYVPMGWILILYHHGVSNSAYNYYNDLNNQLGSDGKLFDPLYVQARSNLKCISDENQLILGNFEISRITETRYFVYYVSESQGYTFRKVPDCFDIPWKGEIIDKKPEFWNW